MTSHRNPDAENDSLAELNQILQKHIRNIWHTAMPGHVVSYDAATRRATVQPALLMVLTGERPLRRPPILNVPVQHPSGGDFIIHIPLAAGDPVWLAFSERGIGAWKRNITAEAMPDKGHYFDMGDAVAFPCFDGPSGTPVIDDGISIQSKDGETYVAIKDGEIEIQANTEVTIRSTGTIFIDGGTVTITGTTTVNGSGLAADGVTDDAAGPGSHSHGLTTA